MPASAQHEKAGPLQHLALTGMSAATAELVTYPVDMVKTRLQLQGEASASGRTSNAATPSSPGQPRLGPIGMLRSITAREGVRGLYAGCGAAMLRHVPYTGTRIPLYEALRGLNQDVDGRTQGGMAAKMLMGATAGAVGQLVAVPADLLKVRLQGDRRNVAAGRYAEPRYRGLAHALVSIVKDEGGVRALWRGTGPAVQRAALVNLGELATYDAAKRALLDSGLLADNVFCHASASVMSGLAAALVSTPMDVAKTRLMNQDALSPAYRGVLDCLVKTASREGVLALYKGFLPTWARLGPWQLTFWVSFEHLRGITGIGGF